jgi:hypothetical protein
MTKIHWLSGVSGIWTTGDDWSGHTVPGASDTAIISAAPTAGPYIIQLELLTTLGGLVLNQAAATLQILPSAQLDIGGVLQLEAGTLEFDGSTLSGGTIVSSGGTFLSDMGALLDGVSVEGRLLLQGESPGDRFNVEGPFNLMPAGSHAATVTVSDANLAFADSQTVLGSGTIKLDGGVLDISGDNSPDATPTLQLGSQFVLDVFGSSAFESGNNGGLIVNEGTISVVGAGNLLTGAGFGDFTNAGTIAIGAGGAFEFAPQLGYEGTPPPSNFTNTGLITVAAGGVLGLTIDSTFSNTGSIRVAGTLALAGATTTAQALSFGLTSSATILLEGAMNNAGTTLDAGTGGTIAGLVLEGGDITGGTIVNAGGVNILSTTGEFGQPNYLDTILSDVTFDGVLSVGAGAVVTLENGTLLHRADGSGNGTIMLNADGGVVQFSGSQRLNGATIEAGTPNIDTTQYPTIGLVDPVPGISTVLTLSGYTRLLSSLLNIDGPYNSGGAQGDTVLNVGTLVLSAGSEIIFNNADLTNEGTLIASGADISFLSGTFINTGTLSLSGSAATLSLVAGDTPVSLDNTGLITLEAGASMEVGGYESSYENAGTIQVDGGTLVLTASLKTSAIGSIQVSGGGLLELGGVISNSFATLALGTGTPLANVDLFALVEGGTVSAAGSGVVFGLPPSPGAAPEPATLSGVTFEGPLILSQANESLAIEGGFALLGQGGSGPGSISLTGAGSTLTFEGETLANTDITIGAAGSAPAYLGNEYGTLTLAKTVSITQAGIQAALGGDIVNDGSITDAVAGGTLLLGGTFTNAGSIAIRNGADLVLNSATLENTGSISITDATVTLEYENLSVLSSLTLVHSVLDITGQLTATGETLSVGAGSAIGLAQISGDMTGGTIHDAGGGVQFFGQNVLLQGVTYQGVLSVSRPFTTITATGLTLEALNGTSPGTMDLTGAGSALLVGSGSVLNDATIDIGNNASSYDGAAVAAPLIAATDYDTIYETAPTLTLGAGLVVSQAGTYAAVGAAANIVASAATIEAGFAGGNFLLSGASFSSSGTIAVSNGDTLTEAAANFDNTGRISVAGSASALILDTAAYFNSGSLAANSFENAGTVVLGGGTLSEAVENGAFPAVPMLNTGLIAGFGTLAVAVNNLGAMEAAGGGTLNLTDQVSGSGLLAVEANSTLLLTGGAGAGVTARFAGTKSVLGLAAPHFLGKIAGFSATDTIDLLKEAATSARFAGDSIVVTLAAGGTLTLATTSALTGSLAVSSDNHGGALITYAPPDLSPNFLPTTHTT